MINYITVDEFNILITRNKDVIGYINKISNEYKIDRLINSASANELKQIANNIDNLNGVKNETPNEMADMRLKWGDPSSYKLSDFPIEELGKNK